MRSYVDITSMFVWAVGVKGKDHLLGTGSGRFFSFFLDALISYTFFFLNGLGESIITSFLFQPSSLPP